MHPQLGICIHEVGTEYVKQNKIKRVQICHKFSDTEQVTSLLKLAKDEGVAISYHAPVYHQVDPSATYYLSKNFRLREATFEILEINVRMASCLPSDYVVIHFTSKTMAAENYDSEDELMTIAKRSIKRLSKLSEAYKININLEYASHMKQFRNPAEWIEIVKDYPNIGICLDIGELFKICTEDGYEFYEKLQEMLPYTKALHIWNSKDSHDLEVHGYIPVHPSQRPEDGWIDIERVVDMVKAQENKIPIIFEPNFDYNGEKYFLEGVNWVNSMMED